MLRASVFCAILGGLCLTTACGGNVIVDKPTGSNSGGTGAQGGTGGQGGVGAQGGQGGVGAQGGQGGVGAQGGQGGGPTTGVGGGDIKSTCEQVCGQLGAYGCTTNTCLNDCANAFNQIPAMCWDEFVTYLKCYLGVIPQQGCMPANACQPETNALGQCLNMGSGVTTGVGGAGGCGTVGCTGDGTYCDCNGVCNGNKLEVTCKYQGNGSYACYCDMNGSQVGSCTESNATCDIQFGCCAPYFGQGI